jgi:DNA gyrase inhibitor GyrI
VAVGLVYLRPKHVTCACVPGNGTAAARLAWQRMHAWLESNAIAGLVTTRYGLEFGPHQISFHNNCYIACVEISSIREIPQMDDCQLNQLPGGAFARQRFVGSCSQIVTALAAIQTELTASNHYSADLSRPCITVFLDRPDFDESTTVKTDLLVPVATLRQVAA